MKVCLVSFEFPPGGGGEGSYTRTLAASLLRSGHSVTLVIPPGRSAADAPEGAEVVRVSVSRAPLLGVASFSLGVRRLLPRLAQRGVDIAHVTFDYPTLPVDLRSAGIPVVATVHHLHLGEALGLYRAGALTPFSPGFARRFLLTRSELRFLSSCDGVIAVSDYTRRSLLTAGVRPEKVVTVRNGVVLPRAGGDHLFRRRFGVDGPFALFVGRLDPSKGVRYLLSAFREAVRVVPGARLVVVGGGPRRYAASLRARAPPGVLFTGRVGAELLSSAYSGASLVVLPSLMEGAGITLLEGMAASKPCVATRVGGTAELVEDGVTGFLAKPGDSGSLATAMARLLSDPETAKRMGREGRRRVELEFSADAMCMGTLGAYGSFGRK